ncbi:MAG: hypothetical protein ACUVR3_10720 [Candidatus Roseilinea sp.]|uniref:hypothetical protein n=1 Tax=Candidatus Roseilinea sp. TaxID=2838777 RepID=UPI004049C1A0
MRSAGLLLCKPALQSALTADQRRAEQPADLLVSPEIGRMGAWLGARVNYTDTLWQHIDLPREATTATLTLWWRMSTNETTTRTVHDVARFGLRDEAGAWVSSPITVTNLSARNTWTAASTVIDVSAQAGRQVQLTLTSSNDYSKTTSWFVDDMALHVCAPQDAWTRPAA